MLFTAIVFLSAAAIALHVNKMRWLFCVKPFE